LLLLLLLLLLGVLRLLLLEVGLALGVRWWGWWWRWGCIVVDDFPSTAAYDARTGFTGSRRRRPLGLRRTRLLLLLGTLLTLYGLLLLLVI
jgi:hypothetical protein